MDPKNRSLGKRSARRLIEPADQLEEEAEAFEDVSLLDVDFDFDESEDFEPSDLPELFEDFELSEDFESDVFVSVEDEPADESLVEPVELDAVLDDLEERESFR